MLQSAICTRSFLTSLGSGVVGGFVQIDVVLEYPPGSSIDQETVMVGWWQVAGCRTESSEIVLLSSG